MSRHGCPRCGIEARCSHGSWPDRHPIAAVLFALPAGYTLVGVMLAYPWFTIPATIIVCAVIVDRRARRRHAIASRADHDHRALMAALLSAPARKGVDQLAGADNLAEQHHFVERPRKFARRPRPRRRPADHWSPTEPIPAANQLLAYEPGVAS